MVGKEKDINSEKGKVVVGDYEIKCEPSDFDKKKLMKSDSGLLLSKLISNYQCKLCGDFFITVSDLKQHRLGIHNLYYACKECAYQSAERCSIDVHTYTVHKSVKVRCCRPFLAFRDFQKHLLRRHGAGEPSISHAASNTQQPPFNYDPSGEITCKECNQEYSTNENLTNHKRLFHESDQFQKRYNCKKCDFVTFSIMGLRRHSKTHSRKHSKTQKGGSYECDICDYTTKYPQNLKIHAKKHLKTIELFCDNCRIVCNANYVAKHKKFCNSDAKVYHNNDNTESTKNDENNFEVAFDVKLY